MDNTQVMRHFKEERARHAEIAGGRLYEMGLPKRLDTPDEILGVGDKAGKAYAKAREELIKEFSTDLPSVIATALHEYWFACWNSATFIREGIRDKSISDNAYTQELATPEGSARSYGWAATLSDGCADMEPSAAKRKWIRQLTGRELLERSISLKCMAVWWFKNAADEREAGNIETACDLLFEANDALSIIAADAMWDDAWKEATKHAEEGISTPAAVIDNEVARRISENARNAALASHRENHQLKAEVFIWCDANRHKDQSRSHAARIISQGLMPIIYTTAYSYITDWDRQHPERFK